MDCRQSRELLWDMEDKSLLASQREELRNHLCLCAECASEAEDIHRIQSALRAPAGLDAEARARVVFAAAMSAACPEGRLPASHWRPRLAAGFLAAAAALVIAVATFWPSPTTALTISQLTEQHRICLLEGHHKNYRCHSEAAFAELAARELGLTPRPFMAPQAGFVRGDVCSVGGKLLAHALLEVNGRTISFFRLAGEGKNLLKNEGWSALPDGAMWRESGSHLILLRELGDNDWGLYTGQAPLEDFKAAISGSS